MNSWKTGVVRSSGRPTVAKAVLDSSALLAFINGETGADFVTGIIADALVSTVNLAEAMTKLVERSGSLDLARAALGVIALDVVDFDRALAEDAGGLVTRTRPYGLSLGDRACLALAVREGIPAVTADRAWRGVDVGVEVKLIR
jgi:ribonuclease VapC